MTKAEEIAKQADVTDCNDDEGCEICIAKQNEVVKAVNAALEWAAQQAQSEPRVWDSGVPDPQARIATKIRAGKSQ